VSCAPCSASIGVRIAETFSSEQFRVVAEFGGVHLREIGRDFVQLAQIAHPRLIDSRAEQRWIRGDRRERHPAAVRLAHDADVSRRRDAVRDEMIGGGFHVGDGVDPTRSVVE
jgi:hypothetical protein